MNLSELLAKSDCARVIVLAEEAVRATEGNEEALQVLAIALYRADRWKESLDAATKARKRREGNAPVEWLYAAMAHAKLGDADKARACFDRGAAKATVMAFAIMKNEGVALVLVLSMLLIVALNRKAAKRFFCLQCVCGSFSVRAADFLFNKIRCRKCDRQWTPRDYTRVDPSVFE